MKKRLAVGLGVVVLGVVAYNIYSANNALVPEASITRLQIVRTSELIHIPPFDMTVTDAAKAQQVYDTMRSLSPRPAGMYSCGADFGIMYTFTFTQRGGPPIEATATLSNCGNVTFANGRGGAIGGDFWDLIATTLGVPVSELYVNPTPDGTGPSAPTPILPTPTPTR